MEKRNMRDWKWGIIGLIVFGIPWSSAGAVVQVMQRGTLETIATPIPTEMVTSTMPVRMLPAQLKVITNVPTPTASNVASPSEFKWRGMVVSKGIEELDVSKIGQEKWLNPQPEPPLPLTPQSVVESRLNYVLSKNKIEQVGKIVTETKEGKAVFTATVKVPAKLLGIIPITIKEKVMMAEDGKATITDKPWYAKISKEEVNIMRNLELKPNLVVKNLRVEPAQFGEGEKVKVIAKIANEGMAMAFGFPDVIGDTGGPTEVLRFLDEGNSAYSWYPIIVYLKPGESEERDDFYVSQVKCGQNLQYEIANTDHSHIDETTKEDNLMQIKLECSK